MNFIKNVSYTISSNLISLVVSTLVILVIPKLIGATEYGYWQVYLFYSSYIGFMHFGWIDGIYLRLGGKQYSELDKSLYHSQFLELTFTQIIIGITVVFFSYFFVEDFNRSFILRMVVIVMLLVNTKSMLLFILQATNRIREYAKITMWDRVVYIILIIILLLYGVRDYKVMIMADLAGKFASLILAMVACKDIVFKNISSFYLTVNEALINVKIGIKLMVANLASTLIIGTVKFGIERTWDIATFGKVSLSLSVSNMMLLFINTVGIVLFPILRRTNVDRLGTIYKTIRDFLMLILFGVLLIYFPLKYVMTAWLPLYSESFKYMAFVFPMFVFEGKTALLINTYLKTLRKESVLLNINLFIMSMSFILTLITTQILGDLNITIINIVILLATKSLLAEFYLSRLLNLKIKKELILETIMTIAFIFLGWSSDSWLYIIVYGLVYFVYILVNKNEIRNSYKEIKVLLSK